MAIGNISFSVEPMGFSNIPSGGDLLLGLDMLSSELSRNSSIRKSQHRKKMERNNPLEPKSSKVAPERNGTGSDRPVSEVRGRLKEGTTRLGGASVEFLVKMLRI